MDFPGFPAINCKSLASTIIKIMPKLRLRINLMIRNSSMHHRRNQSQPNQMHRMACTTYNVGFQVITVYVSSAAITGMRFNLTNESQPRQEQGI